MQIRRKLEWWRARHERLLSVTAFVLVIALLASLCLWLYLSLNVVTVRAADGQTQMLLTASDEPETLVEEAGFTTEEFDEVEVTETQDEGTVVEVQRAFTAAITVDGQRLSGTYTDGTVADMLKENGIALGEHDTVEPAADTPLYEGLTALVNRVEYVEELRREELSEGEVEAYRATLPPALTLAESTNGLTYDVLYRDKLVNGAVAESLLVELFPVIEAPQPRPADSMTIESGVPCSRIESYDDIEFGADGLPLGYTRVMEGAVATAYSARGGRGASGLGLYCGTVAVNPNVIPYGTRLWITDRDQNFVYGFAIATDTGTALMEGHVAIDLFFETNAECLQFGKRALDVYVFGPAPAAEEG